MKVWHNQFLMDEFEGEGGSGGAAETQEGQQQASAAPAIDYSKMAEAFKSVMPTPQQSQAPQMQLTPEQQEQQWRQQTKYPTVTTDQLRPLFGDAVTPEHVKAFDSVMQGYLQHVFAVNGHMVRFAGDELSERFAPALTMAQERKQEQFMNDTVKKYPGLKGREQALQIVIDQVRANGGLGHNNRDQGIMQIASMAEQMLKGFDPNFSLSSGTQANSNGNYSRSAGMVNGGGGSPGSGGGTNQNKGKKSYDKLF